VDGWSLVHDAAFRGHVSLLEYYSRQPRLSKYLVRYGVRSILPEISPIYTLFLQELPFFVQDGTDTSSLAFY